VIVFDVGLTIKQDLFLLVADDSCSPQSLSRMA
jgi:hypothetical protein